MKNLGIVDNRWTKFRFILKESSKKRESYSLQITCTLKIIEQCLRQKYLQTEKNFFEMT